MPSDNRTTQWAFTAYEDQWYLFDRMPPGVAEWGWNTELCPKTNKLHKQGYMRTSGQYRFNPSNRKPSDTLCHLFPGVHIEAAKEWGALKNYCKKPETRAPGTEPVQAIQQYPTLYSYTEELLERLPCWTDVRYLWMDHSDHILRQCKLRQATCEELKLRIYQTPEEFAYGVLLQDLITDDIQQGKPGIAFIVQNPLFICTWKNKIRDLILRVRGIRDTPLSIESRQTDTVTISFA